MLEKHAIRLFMDKRSQLSAMLSPSLPVTQAAVRCSFVADTQWPSFAAISKHPPPYFLISMDIIGQLVSMNLRKIFTQISQIKKVAKDNISAIAAPLGSITLDFRLIFYP
jgi:hypothetical protein